MDLDRLMSLATAKNLAAHGFHGARSNSGNTLNTIRACAREMVNAMPAEKREKALPLAEEFIAKVLML